MTRRARRWWHGVEAEAGDPTGTPEPWADHDGAAATLTVDQRAVLAGLDDQPPPPHLDGLGNGNGIGPSDNDGDGHDPDDQPAVPRLRTDPGTSPGNGTGNAPGAPGPGLSYRRTRWNRRTGREGET